MQELSLNILDIAQNSIRAGAGRVRILVDVSRREDRLVIQVSDDGSGMTPEQAARACDPFYTTRSTRDVGLGISLFKLSAELSGGGLRLESKAGKGTVVTADFVHSHIDRPPLGDLPETVSQLICLNKEIDISYTHRTDEMEFHLSTGEITKILDGVPLDSPRIMRFLREYLKNNLAPDDGGS